LLGALRVVAFAAVTIGAILLARPDRGTPKAAATNGSVKTSDEVRTA
jgi:hypothetical protein